jgi:hypothetical protein
MPGRSKKIFKDRLKKGHCRAIIRPVTVHKTEIKLHNNNKFYIIFNLEIASIMVESKVEEDAAFKIMDNSDNSDSDDEMPDAGLLTMQKQLSIPRVQVSEFNENEEKMHLDVDGMKLAEVADSPLLVGMMSSGAEAKMFKKYS